MPVLHGSCGGRPVRLSNAAVKYDARRIYFYIEKIISTIFFDERKNYKYNYNYSTHMNTTIQIDMITKQRLDLLKKKYNAASYNEVIKTLTATQSDARKMFGSLKGLGPWTKADRGDSKYD